MSSSTPTALVGTADDRLREQSLRWCAALGARVQEVSAAEAVRRGWRAADLVIVGDDLLPALLVTPPPRRDRVVVISDRPDDVWRYAVRIGASGVHGAADERDALDALGSALDGGSEACAISVIGGSGGVGASTFATALALAGVARDLRSVLIDADPDGAGIELALGSERADGQRWPDLDVAAGRLSGPSLADVLPRHRGVATVAWPAAASSAQVSEAAASVWTAATRAFDLVVTDVARRTSEIEVAPAAAATLTVVVVGDGVAALGAARRLVTRQEQVSGPVVAVSAARSSSRRAVEEALGVPVVARFSRSRRTRVDLEHGRGPGRSRSLRRACGGVLELVGL